MAIVAPSQVTVDVSALPAAVQAAITSLDNALSTWTLGEQARIITVQWATLGGYTPAKLQAVKDLLAAYRARGWQCDIGGRTNQTTLYLFFQIPT